MSEPKNEIVVYQPDDTMRLDVRLQDETGLAVAITDVPAVSA